MNEVVALDTPRSWRGRRHGYAVRGERRARAAAVSRALVTVVKHAGGLADKERRRHDLMEQYKQLLRATDDIGVASIGYPGGVCGLIMVREAAVALLVQLIRAERRAP